MTTTRRPTLVATVLLATAMALLPAAIRAQEGTIDFDRTQRYDFQVPEGWEDKFGPMETGGVTPMVLHFNASESVLVPVEVVTTAPTAPEDQLAQQYAIKLKLGSTSRSDQETLLQTWVSHDQGTVVETREFMGRTFLISGPRPTFTWRLTGEEGEFLGYRVQKATATQDSTAIEAWFTPEIPVSAGPGGFGGLPGMILVLTVDGGHMAYTATEVLLEPLSEGAIRAPDDGQEVDREEYEAVVAEKLEELRTLRGNPGTRGKGGGTAPRQP